MKIGIYFHRPTEHIQNISISMKYHQMCLRLGADEVISLVPEGHDKTGLTTKKWWRISEPKELYSGSPLPAQEAAAKNKDFTTVY